MFRGLSLTPGYWQNPEATASSGKLQRRKTREQYLKGELGGEGVRTLGATGEKLTVAKHLAKSLFGRATHVAGKVFGQK